MVMMEKTQTEWLKFLILSPHLASWVEFVLSEFLPTKLRVP